MQDTHISVDALSLDWGHSPVGGRHDTCGIGLANNRVLGLLLTSPRTSPRLSLRRWRSSFLWRRCGRQRLYSSLHSLYSRRNDFAVDSLALHERHVLGVRVSGRIDTSDSSPSDCGTRDLLLNRLARNGDGILPALRQMGQRWSLDVPRNLLP